MLYLQVLDRQGLAEQPGPGHPEGNVAVLVHQLMRQPHRVWRLQQEPLDVARRPGELLRKLRLCIYIYVLFLFI